MRRLTPGDWHTPELELFHRLSEPQLLHYYEPEPGIFIAESPNVIERALAAGYEPLSILMEERHREGRGKKVLELAGDIPVYTADPETMNHMEGFSQEKLSLTRGVLCAMRRKKLPPLEEVLKGTSRIAVLEDVVNPTNVGAIFRSAAALGMDAVLLTAACSDPLYRRSVRVSMGTVFQIPWTILEAGSWPRPAVQMLQERGFHVTAMALKEDSVPIDEPRLQEQDRLAVVLGTEGEGLREETIAACDDTVIIPMYHGVDSLNVAAASAVAFWQLRKHSGEQRENGGKP